MNLIFRSLLILGLLTGCGDIIEKNISRKEVLLRAPGDGVIIYSDTVSFWWEILDGARSYEFILVSPTFDSVQQVLVDSVTSDNFLTFSLDQGGYQWQVRALNEGYTTDYFSRSFRVDTAASVDISSEVMEIVSPVDDVLLADQDVTFWWEKLEGANQYDLRIARPSFRNPKFGMDTTLSKNIYNVQLDTGAYEWRVRGTNSRYSTPWMDGSFSILNDGSRDISEEEVALLAPVNNLETTNRSIIFWWDELEYADSYDLVIVSPSFDDIQVLILDQSLEDTQLELELDAGSYEWEVRAVNESSQTEYSIRSLYILE